MSTSSLYFRHLYCYGECSVLWCHCSLIVVLIVMGLWPRHWCTSRTPVVFHGGTPMEHPRNTGGTLAAPDALSSPNHLSARPYKSLSLEDKDCIQQHCPGRTNVDNSLTILSSRTMPSKMDDLAWCWGPLDTAGRPRRSVTTRHRANHPRLLAVLLSSLCQGESRNCVVIFATTSSREFPVLRDPFQFRGDYNSVNSILRSFSRDWHLVLVTAFQATSNCQNQNQWLASTSLTVLLNHNQYSSSHITPEFHDSISQFGTAFNHNCSFVILPFFSADNSMSA